MSAITAIYNLDGKLVSQREMQIVLDRLKHRGDDDAGVWIDGSIGFGHRMRWVTPESRHEKLPMKSAESSLVMTCDARIDNRDDLIPQLSFSGKPITEITDAEIIIRAYEKWGEECLPKLIGDFVFLIWDARRQKLICARDPMGIKHFYYYHQPGRIFAVASEPKALFGLRDIKCELNETNIGDILILNYQDKENTPYKKIKRLPANQVLTVDRDNLKIRQYWRPTKSSAKFRFRSDQDYEEEFRELFTEAVRCRLRSIHPVGTELSGGLDSSSITAVASCCLEKSGKAPLETFSAIFPAIAEIDQRIDERKFIKSVVEDNRCVPNYVEADSFSPFREIEKLQWHTDHPVGAPNVFMDWALYEAAQTKGVNVLLSGFDGDSTVSYGYEAFYYFARHGRWLGLVKNALALNKNMPARQHRFKNLVWKQGIYAALPKMIFQVWRLLHGKSATPVKSENLPFPLSYNYNLIKSGFAENLNLKKRYFDLVEKNEPQAVSDVEAHWNGLTSGLFAFALESFDKASAAFGIEPRYPFFDRRLIEFCIGLSYKQKVAQGWTRSLFRRAMSGILPPEVQWRTDKAIIGLSFKVNMVKYGRETVDESVYAVPNVLEKYIDSAVLINAYEKYKSDPSKHDGEAMFVLSSVYLSNWLRKSGVLSAPVCSEPSLN